MWLSFLIPFFILLSTFIVQGVHPFGSRMILTVDLYHQYAPFVAELRDKILSGDSLFYSWNVGLGTNFFAIFANYAASPLNLLILLFPQRFLSDGIMFLVCLRAGLTGLFFAMMLRDMDNRREDLFLSCFSAMYALCGWVLAYFWNIMWLDAVMLLPLVILGLRRLIRDRKPLLYCVSLFFVVLSNYYAAFFVCLFLVLYAPVAYVQITPRFRFGSLWASFWRFCLYSALGGAMAAILVYPTWTALKQSSATGDAWPTDYSLTQNLFDFLGRFFVAGKPNIRDGMANVYCGVIILIFIPLFFLCRRIRLREKIGYGFLLAVLYFSFANKLLNFIWHGLHYPNQIPYREAFLMSFVLVIMAYKVLRNLKSFTIHEITLSLAVVLAYVVLYEKFSVDGEKIWAIYLTALFVILYAAALRLILYKKAGLNTQKYFLAGLLIAELLIGTQVTVGTVAYNESFTNWDFYGKKSGEVTAFIDAREKSGEDGPFIRAEMYPALISNETALYHVKGVSCFSSTADESFIQFMKSLGFHNNGINGVRNAGLTKVTASLLGIRYLIDVNGTSTLPGGFTKLNDTGNLTVFENTDALSVGYMVSPDVLDFVTVNQNNPFKTTDKFLEALGTDGVYNPEVLLPGMTVNATMTSGNGYMYNIPTDGQAASIEFEPNARIKGEHLYVYVQSAKAPNVTLTTTDPITGKISTSTEETRVMQIIDIGTYDPEAELKVKLSWSAASAGQVILYCVSLTDDSYRKMISDLGESELAVTSYDTTHLNGTIDAPADGVMLLTVTYDQGWTARVDGKTAEIVSIGDALMGIRLSGGHHEISMTYRPGGFNTGALVSAGAFVLLILLTAIPAAFEYRRKKRIAALYRAEGAGLFVSGSDAAPENSPDPLPPTTAFPEDTSVPDDQIRDDGDEDV